LAEKRPALTIDNRYGWRLTTILALAEVCVDIKAGLKNRTQEMSGGEQTNKKENIGETPVWRQPVLGGGGHAGGVLGCGIREGSTRGEK
jgi:hypothetical protein